jgi:glycine oxidase
MSSKATATVAGAGALGLSCALALADAGFAVTVCDPAEPFVNASGVAGGMLAPVFEAVLDVAAAPHFNLLLAARDLWPGLEARSGVRLDRAGALAVGRRDWLQRVAADVTRLGLHAPEIPFKAAAALAPGLTDDAEGVLLNREDWRLDARPALEALRGAAEAAGVAFRQERVTGRGQADLLLVATGAAGGLAPEAACLSPIKGHILKTAPNDLGGVTVRGEGIYVTPADGGLAIGATMEPGLADATPDPAQAPPLRARGATLFPALAEVGCELQAGVRAATPDGLPLVGFSAEPGVLLATGARRNGWLLAPLVAGVVAALAAGRDPGRYAARLDPKRFSAGA